MGTREGFICSTNPKINVEILGEMLARSGALTTEYPDVWINCKAVAVKDTTLDSFTDFGGNTQAIAPIYIKEGQEYLCVGYDSSVNVEILFPNIVRRKLMFFESWRLDGRPYNEVFKDKPIEIDGKSYMAELCK